MGWKLNVRRAISFIGVPILNRLNGIAAQTGWSTSGLSILNLWVVDLQNDGNPD
ncbi:MAG: hypothetical protein AAFO87_06305 [Cyanobacteria bacterium J06607_6]